MRVPTLRQSYTHSNAYLLPLPIPHMIQNNPRRRLRTMLPSNRLHKIPLRIHQIKIYTMIHQIILSLLHILRCREINPILLTNVLNLLIRPCQSNNTRMKLGQVFLEDAWSVAGGVAGYEDWEDGLGFG